MRNTGPHEPRVLHGQPFVAPLLPSFYAVPSPTAYWPGYSPVHPPPPSPALSPLEVGFVRPAKGPALFDGLPHSSESFRNPDEWFRDHAVTEEERILVAIRSLTRTGFETLGDFLEALLSSKKNGQHQTVAQKTSAFVSGRTRAGTRPADIIQLLYEHRSAEDYINGRPVPLSYPLLPRYARGPAERASLNPAIDRAISTRTSVLQWAVLTVMKRVDTELDGLIKEGSFTVMPGTRLTWDMILSWDMKAKEGLIAKKVVITSVNVIHVLNLSHRPPLCMRCYLQWPLATLLAENWTMCSRTTFQARENHLSRISKMTTT